MGNADLRPDDDRAAVAAVAVHQHQAVIRRQTAKVDRPHHSRSVAVNGTDVHGRRHVAQQHVQAGFALPGQRFPRKHIHRNQGLGCTAPPRPASRHHDLFRNLAGSDCGLSGFGRRPFCRVRLRCCGAAAGLLRRRRADSGQEQQEHNGRRTEHWKIIA